jgi:hypothetical protein
MYYVAGMKIIKTTLSNAEYQLLEQYAKANGNSIDTVVHEAIRVTIDGNVDPNDPIFTRSSSHASGKATDRGSVDHDKRLYAP